MKLRVVLPIALFALLLGVWELYARLGPLDPLILPAPDQIASSLWDDRSLLWDNLTVTGKEVLLGVLASVLAGIVCAAAIHLSATLRRAVYPLLVASQTLPIVIVAPLLVAWFGYGITPKLAIVALICFFPVTVTTLDASRWQIFRRLEAPSALPGLLSGTKIAVTVAVIGAVLAEQAGSSDGLGHLLLQAVPQLQTPRAYAAVVLLSALALALFGALTLAERLAVPWAPRTRRRTA